MENIDQLIQMDFIKMSNYEELRSWSANSRTFFIIILGSMAMFVIQMTVLVKYIEEEGLSYESTL